MFSLKPFDFNDFSLKLTKYLMLPNSHFLYKSEIDLPQETQQVALATSVCLPCTLHKLAAVNQIVDKNPLRMVSLLLYSNKIISMNSEQMWL